MIKRADLAYTALWHLQKGGQLFYRPYLRAQYLFGLKIPQDAAKHLLGVGEDSTKNYFRMLRIATAFAELHTSREMQFGDGTLEIDSTAGVIKFTLKLTKCTELRRRVQPKACVFFLPSIPFQLIVKHPQFWSP